ncbi:MAG: hypothetical protein ACC682_13800, partial [Gemmatimonadota bacterium]
MADERRYGEDEVDEIFSLATRTGDARLPAPTVQEGLTLGELQDVGREVGLSPERVAEAASTLDARLETLPRATAFGAPVSVGRVIEVPRAATDREWQVLVSELRETFDARGRVASHGDMREWTNGNLHAFLEPTATGHRLRLGTRKTGATMVSAIGAVGLAAGLLLLVTAGLDEATFGTFRATLIPAVVALAGGGMLTRNLLRLRRWADER